MGNRIDDALLIKAERQKAKAKKNLKKHFILKSNE